MCGCNAAIKQMDNERISRQEKGYKEKGKNFKPNYNYKKKPQGKNSYNGFSKDDDVYEPKKFESKKRISSNKDKMKEIQTDKADIAKRIEKEKKKVMQKKKQDNKKTHQQRTQIKAKRSNNIDWTREYENDSYDDDDMSYYY